jgi:hypothetical protein
VTGFVDPTGLKLLEVVAPVRDLAHGMVKVAQAMALEHGQLPAALSPAMDELARETSCAGSWSPTPLHLGQSIGSLCIAAAQDHLLSLCYLLTPPADGSDFRAPVVGHMALARAVAETSGRVSWMLEPGIAYEVRASRAVAELLYSRNERAKIDDGSRTLMTRLKADVRAECASRGLMFSSDDGARITVGERRPGNAAAVDHLFRTMVEPSFAKRMYSYYSGAAHGVLWALLESVNASSPKVTSLDPDTRSMYASARSLFSCVAVATEAHRRAFEIRSDHMGWEQPARWHELTRELEATVSSTTFIEDS